MARTCEGSYDPTRMPGLYLEELKALKSVDLISKAQELTLKLLIEELEQRQIEEWLATEAARLAEFPSNPQKLDEELQLYEEAS